MSSEDKSVDPSDQGPSPPLSSAGATPSGSPAPSDKRPRGRPRKDAAAPKRKYVSSSRNCFRPVSGIVLSCAVLGHEFIAAGFASKAFLVLEVLKDPGPAKFGDLFIYFYFFSLTKNGN